MLPLVAGGLARADGFVPVWRKLQITNYKFLNSSALSALRL